MSINNGSIRCKSHCQPSKTVAATFMTTWQGHHFLPLVAVALLLLAGCQLPGFGGHESGKAVEAAKNPCVVLALPNSGPFAATAGKIRKGAAIAQNQLKTGGTNLRLENINTESQDWLAKLASLPPMCTVVGGPLQDRKYLEARKDDILDKKIFFTFTPGLQKGDEGKVAWRFFPSPQDQIDALTHFVTDDLNIHTYGAFYPSDTYGRRMVELLESTLGKRHIPVHKAAYDAKSPATWSESVKPIINPATPDGGKIPVPQTTFEALFVPDSWKHMDLVTQSLLYNGEDRLVLMGPMLWEQPLAGKKISKPEKFELAIFPAAWNGKRAPKALQGGGNDFWVALGYDFVNFAVTTGLAERASAADVLARAQRASSSIKAMAPINWDSDGIGRQHLYVFEVTGNGSSVANPEQFRQKRSALLERSALRMQGIQVENINAPEPSVKADDIDAPAISEPVARPVISAPVSEPATQVAPQAPLSTTPRPSYKLSLPARR